MRTNLLKFSKDDLDKLLNTAGNNTLNAGATAQRFLESPKPFNIIPQVNIRPAEQRQNYIPMSQRALQALQQYQKPIVGAQHMAEGFINGLMNLPKNIIEAPLNEAANTGVDIGRIIARPQVPQYGDLKSSLAKLSYNIASIAAPKRVSPLQLKIKNTPQEIIGNYGGAAAPYAPFASGIGLTSGMETGSIASQMPKNILAAFTKGAVKQMPVGFATGFLNGLAQAKDAKTIHDQLVGAVKSGAISAAQFAMLGGLTSSGKYAVDTAKTKAMLQYYKTEHTADGFPVKKPDAALQRGAVDFNAEVSLPGGSNAQNLANKLATEGKLNPEDTKALLADPGIQAALKKSDYVTPDMIDTAVNKGDVRGLLTLIKVNMDDATKKMVGDLNRADAVGTGINYQSGKPLTQTPQSNTGLQASPESQAIYESVKNGDFKKAWDIAANLPPTHPQKQALQDLVMGASQAQPATHVLPQNMQELQAGKIDFNAEVMPKSTAIPKGVDLTPEQYFTQKAQQLGKKGLTLDEIAFLQGADAKTTAGKAAMGEAARTKGKDATWDQIYSKADQAYTQAIDTYHPLTRIADSAGGEEKIAMRKALTQYYGATSTAQYHLEFQLKPILQGTDANDLRQYVIAQRDIELAGRGIQGSNTEAPNKVLTELKSKYGADYPKLAESAQKLYSYQSDLVKEYLVDTGIISTENYRKMLSKNQKYVPFKRVMDEVDGYLGVEKPRSAGSVRSQGVIKKIKGSSKDIVDPLESMVENTYKIVSLGRRNQVAKVIAGLNKDYPEMVKPIAPQMVPVATISRKEEIYPEVVDAIKQVTQQYGADYERVPKFRGGEAGHFASKVSGNAAAGSLDGSTLRVKQGAPKDVDWHEFGHLLDKKYNLQDEGFFDKSVSSELRKVADLRSPAEGGSMGYKNYTRKAEEKLAEFTAMFFSDRKNAERVAPVTTRKFAAFIKDKPELQNLVKVSRSRVLGAEQIDETIFRPSVFEPKVPHISVFLDGKQKYYEVPKDVSEAARGLQEESLNAVVKILSYPAKIVRATATTYNPEFMLPNVTRDLQSAYVNEGLNPLKFVKGLVHLARKDEVYQDFLKSGGRTSRVSLDRPQLTKYVGELTNPVGIELKRPSDILRIMQKAGDYSEQPTRIALFEDARSKALNSGMDAEAAGARGAYMAQEGTVNFARHGSKMPAINALSAFINARMQGVDRLARTVKDDPKGAGLRLALITQVPAVLLYLYNRNFQSYSQERVVPQYEKDRNFILMLSDKPIPELGGKQYIKIPKGDVGQFANPTENFMAHVDGKKDLDTLGSIARAFGSFSPYNNLGDVLPNAIKPIYENQANYSFFKDQQLYPTYKEGYPEGYKDNANTPSMYKLIGRKINYSPAKLENLSAGYLTGLEKMATPVTNAIAETIDPTTASKNKPAPEIPVLRRFLGGEKRTEDEQQKMEASGSFRVLQQIDDIQRAMDTKQLPEAAGLQQIEKLKQEYNASQPDNNKPYYQSITEAKMNLNPTERSAFDAIPDSDPADLQGKIYKYRTMLQYPAVYNAKKEASIAQAGGNMSKVDPLYTVPFETARQYMLYQAYGGNDLGSKDAKDIYKAYPAIGELGKARSEFFQANPLPGDQPQSVEPFPSKHAQEQMDLKNWNDPEVQAYFQAHDAYVNEQRAKAGLPALAGFTAYAKKPKKVSMGKFKVPKINIKIPKSSVKPVRLSKLKKSKANLSFKLKLHKPTSKALFTMTA